MVNLPLTPISSDAYLTSLDEIETLIGAYRSVIMFVADYRSSVLDQYPRFISRVVEERTEYDVTARHLRDSALNIVRDYASKLLFLLSRWQIAYEAIEHVIAKNSVKTVHTTNTHTDNVTITNTTTTVITQRVSTWTPGALQGSGDYQHDASVSDYPFHGVIANGHFTSIGDAKASFKRLMQIPDWLTDSQLEVRARWYTGSWGAPSLSLNLRVELVLRAKKYNPLMIRVKEGGGAVSITAFNYQWNETQLKVRLVGRNYTSEHTIPMYTVPSASTAKGLEIESSNWSVTNDFQGDDSPSEDADPVTFQNLPAGDYELYSVSGSSAAISSIVFTNADIVRVDSIEETTTDSDTTTTSSDDSSTDETTEYTNVEFRDLVDDMNDVMTQVRTFATTLLELEDTNPPTPSAE